MTDRELLELAARAAGVYGLTWDDAWGCLTDFEGQTFDPLTDDGDALRLAVKLNLSMDLFDDEILVGYTPNSNECDQVLELPNNDPYAATRRAIVRAAAAIGEGMK